MEKFMIIGKWYVRILEEGDAYGLDDCLNWEYDKSGVEFYDYSQDKDKFGYRGQFVSRYFVRTLLEDAQTEYYETNRGLSLYADIPSWTVSNREMRVIIQFIGAYADVK